METLYEVLALTSEAALFIKEGRVDYANAAARRLLGDGCAGCQADSLFRMELSQPLSGMSLADTVCNGENLLLRVSPLADGRLVFLEKQEEPPTLFSDGFLFYLRSHLMTLGLAADSIRPRAEDLGDTELLNTLARLTHSYYTLMRLTENAALARREYDPDTPFSTAELDLSLLCHAVLDAAEEHFPAVAFRREIPSGLRLVADARLLRLLLFNLISNALLHAQPHTVCLSVFEGKERTILSVSDDGCGIPEEELSTVFCRCRQAFRLDSAGQGIGFGLSAARSITQLHGGSLLIESREQVGTTVRAAISRSLQVNSLNCGNELCTMRDVLLGLADCLPEDCFRETFMD